MQQALALPQEVRSRREALPTSTLVRCILGHLNAKVLIMKVPGCGYDSADFMIQRISIRSGYAIELIP